MIYIGNFRDIDDKLFTVTLETEAESDTKPLSPPYKVVDDKFTFSLSEKGVYKVDLYDLSLFSLDSCTNDTYALYKDGTVYTIITYSDNQELTIKGDENELREVTFTYSKSKYITLAFENPVTVNSEGDTSDVYKCAKYSRMTINVINDKIYDDLFATRSNSVSAVLYKEGNIEWQGYLTPNIYSQDYAYYKNELQLECIDNISVLQYEPYKEKGNEVTEARTFRYLLDRVLKERFDKVYYPLNIKLGKAKNPEGDLPFGYTRLDYIRTDGKAYIDTGVEPYLYSGIDCSFRADYRYITPTILGNYPSAYFYGIRNNISAFLGGVFLREDGRKLSENVNDSYIGWVGWNYKRKYEFERLRNIPTNDRARAEYSNPEINELLFQKGWDSSLRESYVSMRDVPYYDKVHLTKSAFATFKRIFFQVEDNNYQYGNISMILGKQIIGDYKDYFYYATDWRKPMSSTHYNEVSSYSISDSLLLFGCKTNTAIAHSPTNTDCQYFKMYNYVSGEGNQLVLDLIPCIRQSDGQVGMYDTVSDRFFGNVNPEGAFIPGTVVDDNVGGQLSEDEFETYVTLDNLTVSDKTWYRETNKTWEVDKNVFEELISYLGLTAIAKGKELYLLDYEHLGEDSEYLILDKNLNSTGVTTILYDVEEFSGSADDQTTISRVGPYSEVKLEMNTKELENVTDKIFNTGKELIKGHTYTGSETSTEENQLYINIWNENVITSKYVDSYIWDVTGHTFNQQTSDSYFKAFYELDPTINPQERVDDNETIGYIAKTGSIKYQQGTDTSHISKALNKESSSNVIRIVPELGRVMDYVDLVKIKVSNKETIIPSNAFLTVNFSIFFSDKRCFENDHPTDTFTVTSDKLNVPIRIKYGDYYYTSNGWRTQEWLNTRELPNYIEIPLETDKSTDNQVFGTRYDVVNQVEYDLNIEATGYTIPMFTSTISDVNEPEELTVSFINFYNPGDDGTDSKLAKSYFITNLDVKLASRKEENVLSDEEEDDIEEVIDRTYVQDYSINDFGIFSYNNKNIGYNTVYAFLNNNLYVVNSAYNEDLNMIGKFEEFAVRKRVIQYSSPRLNLSQSLFGTYDPYTKFRNEVIYGDVNFVIDSEEIDYRTNVTTLNLIEKR